MKITNFVTPGEKPAFKQIFTEHLLYNRQCEGLKKITARSHSLETRWRD